MHDQGKLPGGIRRMGTAPVISTRFGMLVCIHVVVMMEGDSLLPIHFLYSQQLLFLALCNVKLSVGSAGLFFFAFKDSD